MAGGSQIVINNQGITITTNGEVIFKAGQHKFEKAVEVGVNLRGLPSYESYNEKFQMLSPSGEVMSHVGYKTSNADQSFIAITDRKGLSKRVNTDSEKNLKVDLHWISLEKEDEGDQ